MTGRERSLKNRGIVLIVDDTPGNLAVLSDMLSEANYRVLVATDGQSALEQIRYLKPDVILLDVMMPGIDGFETCRRLKAEHQTRTIPIIFMTGLSELDDLLRGFQEGAVDFIVKPIKPAEVLARVDAQLAQIKNLQRAEQTLEQINFAAIAFDNKGLVTWLTSTAVKILHDALHCDTESSQELRSGDYLPEQLLQQVQPFLITGDALNADIKVGEAYSGKLIHCMRDTENLMLIQKNAQQWDQATLKASFGLTAREAEILMWISKGKTNKETGQILQTSPRTINKHLEHVFEKLGVPTRTAAVAKVLNTQ